ncbi:MAG: hypothetical protein L0220_18805, partial [Acidobacteria bacterium]|nr:hypothetical protein [Acidobacteriota bacterium]
ERRREKERKIVGRCLFVFSLRILGWLCASAVNGLLFGCITLFKLSPNLPHFKLSIFRSKETIGDRMLESEQTGDEITRA